MSFLRLIGGDSSTIGYTSFEEPTLNCQFSYPTSTTCSVLMYYDTDGEGNDHYLPDHAGQNIVEYSACSAVPDGASLAELGFRTFYHSNDPDEGMAGGAKLGVIGDISTPQRGDYSQGGPAPDGSQYYMMEDTGVHLSHFLTTFVHFCGNFWQLLLGFDSFPVGLLCISDGFVYVEIDPVDVRDYTGVLMSGWAHIESATWEDTDHLKMWATDTVTGTRDLRITVGRPLLGAFLSWLLG